MAKLTQQPQLAGLSDPVEAKMLAGVLQAIWQQICRIVNAGLTFGNPTAGSDNMRGAWYDATTAAANTEFAVTHNLGYVPQGWITMYRDKACSVYAGTTAWTSTQIFLKCDTATVHLRLFVIG